MAPVAMIAPWPGISRGIEPNGADRAGIGERNRRALEIRGHQLAGAGARDDIVEGRKILLEIQPAGVLDIRHHQ